MKRLNPLQRSKKEKGSIMQKPSNVAFSFFGKAMTKTVGLLVLIQSQLGMALFRNFEVVWFT